MSSTELAVSEAKSQRFSERPCRSAWTFFLNNSRDNMYLTVMKRVMIVEYNSEERQLQVQGMLETFRLDRYMRENDLSDHYTGLTLGVDLIERLTPQC